MKAIVVKQQEGYPLVWQEVNDPVCRPGDVLVDVYATALNRADLSQRVGKYPPPPGETEIMGLELAGVIRETGEDVTDWQVGDKVCALLAGGGYAEQVCVPVAMLMPIPAGWSFAEAAGFSEVFFTAFLNLFIEAKLERGETVLIHGGASGVGTAAIQLAHEAGCRVLTTAGSEEKTAVCRELGAELAINYHQEDFVERIKAYTDGNGVDVVLDMVGADYLSRNLELLSTGGRLVFIATLSGSKAEIDIRQLMSKRLLLKGSTLRARPLQEKVRLKEALMAQFWGALEAGTIKPVLDRSYPIRDVAVAHDRMRENKNIGKIILKVRE